MSSENVEFTFTLLLNRAEFPQFRLWNIHSDKFHFNDSSDPDDPGYDLWLKYYVRLLCHVPVYLRRRRLLPLRSIHTTYAVCVCRRTTYAGLFFFFCFNLASSISLAWFGTLFYSLSSIIMNVAVFNPQKNVWFVARRTAKSLHTSYIIVGEWKFFMVEKLEHVCRR